MSEKIKINETAVNGAIRSITKTEGILQDASSQIPNAFSTLTEVGFGSNTINSLIKQINYVINTLEEVSNSIANHVQEIIEKENSLKSDFDNNYFVELNFGDGNPSSLTGTDSVLIQNLNSIINGKNINNENINNFIADLDAEQIEELYTLININRGETSAEDILFNYEKSEELYKILSEVCGNDVTDSSLSLDDYEKVQKKLLDKLVTTEAEVPELESKTLLSARNYLRNLGQQCGLNPSDLITDIRYKGTLKTALKKVYDGTATNMRDCEISSFRNYIDRIATKNNTTSSEILNNKIDTLL